MIHHLLKSLPLRLWEFCRRFLISIIITLFTWIPTYYSLVSLYTPLHKPQASEFFQFLKMSLLSPQHQLFTPQKTYLNSLNVKVLQQAVCDIVFTIITYIGIWVVGEFLCNFSRRPVTLRQQGPCEFVRLWALVLHSGMTGSRHLICSQRSKKMNKWILGAKPVMFVFISLENRLMLKSLIEIPICRYSVTELSHSHLLLYWLWLLSHPRSRGK